MEVLIIAVNTVSRVTWRVAHSLHELFQLHILSPRFNRGSTDTIGNPKYISKGYWGANRGLEIDMCNDKKHVGHQSWHHSTTWVAEHSDSMLACTTKEMQTGE